MMLQFLTLRRTLLLAAALMIPLTTAQDASAQCGLNGCGGYGYGCAFDIGRLYRVLADNVPHYAAFPPVYYSLPVARSYGYSPFAYPPGYATPEVSVAQPQTIENPYMNVQPAGGTGDGAATEDKTTTVEVTSAPLVITNPYVTDLQTAAR